MTRRIREHLGCDGQLVISAAGFFCVYKIEKYVWKNISPGFTFSLLKFQNVGICQYKLSVLQHLYHFYDQPEDSRCTLRFFSSLRYSVPCCACVCVCMSAHACSYICACVCRFICVTVCAYVHACVCEYVNMFVCVCICVYMSTKKLELRRQ